MKKFLVFIIVVLLAGIAGAAVYMKAIKPDFKEFIVEGTDLFGYGENQKKYREEFKEIEELALKLNKELLNEAGEDSEKTLKMYEEINKYNQFINKMGIIHLSQDLTAIKETKDLKAVLIADPGEVYPAALAMLGNYFDKNEEIYKLKKEVIENILKEKGVMAEEQNIEVFMKPYKGYFIFSFSDKFLYEYLSVVENKKAEIKMTAEYEKLKKNYIGFYVIDIKKEYNKFKDKIPTETENYIKEPDLLKIMYGYDFGKKEFIATVELTGTGPIFEKLDSSLLKERKLTNYISKNTVYFSNNSFKTLGEYLIKETAKFTGVDYAMLAQAFTGADIYSVLDNMGNEAIIKIEEKSKYSAVTNIKDTKPIEDILNKFKIPADDNGSYKINEENILKFKDGKMFYNQEIKSSDKINISKDIFLYSKVDMEKLGEEYINYKGFVYEVSARSSGKNIAFDFKMNKSDLKIVLENMPKLIKEQKEKIEKEREKYLQESLYDTEEGYNTTEE